MNFHAIVRGDAPTQKCIAIAFWKLDISAHSPPDPIVRVVPCPFNIDVAASQKSDYAKS